MACKECNRKGFRPKAQVDNMGNSISSNLMAMRTLNSLNKNIKKKEQAAHHLSLGELIGSAGDDASRYSIGEKMKVRIRASRLL